MRCYHQLFLTNCSYCFVKKGGCVLGQCIYVSYANIIALCDLYTLVITISISFLLRLHVFMPVIYGKYQFPMNLDNLLPVVVLTALVK